MEQAGPDGGPYRPGDLTRRCFDWDNALRLALFIGLTPAQFDALTPRELLMLYKAHRKRERLEERRRQLLAYDTAVCVVSFLGAALGGKGIPPFGQVFGDGPKEMSEEAIAAAIESLNRALGGAEVFNTEGGGANGSR